MQSDKVFYTEPNQTLDKLQCKLVASIESSNDYSAQSKVEEYFHFGQAQPFQQQIAPKYNFNKLDKLEQQLNSIEQLKHNYESKNERFKNFNTQNSEKSRSIEKKHNLKPSQTPHFMKRFETQKPEEETKESVSNIQSSLNESNVRSEISDKRVSVDTKVAEFYELSKKFAHLQEEMSHKNRVIENLNQTIVQLRGNKSNQQYRDQNLYQQNRILKLDLQSMRIQKQQLETILKDLLFQRQRQRLFGQMKDNGNKTPSSHSTVVSSRKSFTPSRNTITKPSPRGENVNSNHFFDRMERHSGNKTGQREKQRTRQNKTALDEISIVNEEQRYEKQGRQMTKKGVIVEESKKMKVQNILDKLKIKINKV